VTTVLMTAGNSGVITVTYSANIPQASGKTLALTPFLNGALLSAAAATATGNVDWACASTTQATATSNGLTGATAGTIPAKYVPTQCK
jgi:type IV pilus assembly protein PilA